VSLDASDVGAFADDATIPVANGGTGATAAANARANLGIPEPGNATQLWSNSTAIDISGQSLTLSETPLGNYRYLYAQVYANSPTGGTRGLIFAPASAITSATFLPLMCGGNAGYVRLELSGTTLNVIAQSYNALYCNVIFGVK
jgi:hypothetical protein